MQNPRLRSPPHEGLLHPINDQPPLGNKPHPQSPYLLQLICLHTSEIPEGIRKEQTETKNETKERDDEAVHDNENEITFNQSSPLQVKDYNNGFLKNFCFGDR